MDVSYPEVTVQLTGEDGNVFAIIGRVSRAIERSDYLEGRTKARAFREAATACHSYDEVLQLCMKTVHVK